MNWVDYVVIGIIFGFAMIGYARGFVYSVFKVASFFIAAFASIKFYPVVSRILMAGLHVDLIVKDMISKNLVSNVYLGETSRKVGMEAVKDLVWSWGLPKPVEDIIIQNVSLKISNVAINVPEALSTSLATIIVNIMGIIIVFALVNFILIFVRSFLMGIAQLPIFKQINRLGGLTFGFLEGLIIVYVGFAILTLFSASSDFKPIFTSINSSVIAKQFYTNNLLLLWAFGSKVK